MSKATYSPATSVWALSALALSFGALGASAAVDTGLRLNGGDAAESYLDIDNAITGMMDRSSANNIRRRHLQSSWCTVVSTGDTYCCGFGGQASCIARGLEYSGPSTPCEVRLVTDSDGEMTCEGLSGASGNLDDCNCEDLNTDPPPTPSPTFVEATEMPAETMAPDATMAPDSTEMPAETMAPDATEMPTETMAPEATMAPDSTEMPAETMAPDATEMPAQATLAPVATEMPAETMAPDATEMPAETMAPDATMAPDVTPSPTETSRGILLTMAPGVATPSPTAATRGIAFTASPTTTVLESAAPTTTMTMAPSSAPTMMTMAPTMAPTMSTGMPTTSPTMMPTATPTAGSRGLDLGSDSPTSAPTAAPTTLLEYISEAPLFVDATTGSSRTFGVSGGVLALTFASAIALGLFVV